MWPSIRPRARSHELTRALVGHGLGYAILAQRGPGRMTGGGRAVTAVKIADPIDSLSVVLVPSPAAESSAVAKAFIAIARERAG